MADHHIGMNMVTIRNGRDADVLLENLDRLSVVGFQGVGVWTDTIEGWLSAGHTVAELAREITERGLSVYEVLPGRVLDDQGKLSDCREVFEWAKALGSPAVICVYGRPDTPLEKVQDDWAAFVRSVEDIGVAAAFEFIGPWPRYNCPVDAWNVIQAGPELGTMTFDTFHFWRGGCDMSQLDRFPGRRVSLVHLNDVKDVPQQEADDSDRTYPGEGTIPLTDILGALLRNGFTGPFSVEIFGEVQEQDPDEVSARAYASSARVLEAI